MAACETHGHLFGSNDRCVMCGDPAPAVPAFLRGAREPDARDAELARLRIALDQAQADAALHAAAWRALGYVLGKFPELSQVIFDEIRAHNIIIGNGEGVGL